jgi:hypothetical protein
VRRSTRPDATSDAHQLGEWTTHAGEEEKAHSRERGTAGCVRSIQAHAKTKLGVARCRSHEELHTRYRYC